MFFFRGRRRDFVNGDASAVPSERDSQESKRDRAEQLGSRAATLRYKLKDLVLEQKMWEGEEARRSQFRICLDTIEEQFLRAEAERNNLFRDAELRQAREWQGNEERRSAVFKGRETAYELAFEEQQNAQRSKSAWFAELIDTTLQAGREERAKDCEKLKKIVAKTVKALLRSQDDAFKEEERQRDSTIQHVVSALGVTALSWKLILDLSLVFEIWRT
jgi:hypothetical protein